MATQRHIAQIHTLTGMHSDQGLMFAAAAEARQTHPIARAILAAAAELELQLPMTMEGIVLPSQGQTLTEACQAQGHSLVMVAVNDELVGCIELQPTVRPEAQRIIASESRSSSLLPSKAPSRCNSAMGATLPMSQGMSHRCLAQN